MLELQVAGSVTDVDVGTLHTSDEEEQVIGWACWPGSPGVIDVSRLGLNDEAQARQALAAEFDVDPAVLNLQWVETDDDIWNDHERADLAALRGEFLNVSPLSLEDRYAKWGYRGAQQWALATHPPSLVIGRSSVYFAPVRVGHRWADVPARTRRPRRRVTRTCRGSPGGDDPSHPGPALAGSRSFLTSRRWSS